MSKCDTIVPLIYAMKKRRDVIHTTADTIKKMFDMMIPELVVQVCTLNDLIMLHYILFIPHNIH